MFIYPRLLQAFVLVVALPANVAAVPGPTEVSPNKIKILQRRNLGSSDNNPDDFHSYYDVEMDLHLEDSSADSILEFTWPNGQVRTFSKDIGDDYQASWAAQSENGGRANIIHQSDTDRYHGSFVDYDGGDWTICQMRPDANGNHLMDCADGADFPEEADALVPEDLDQGDGALIPEQSEAERLYPNEARSLQVDIATIDIMVLWTTDAECRVSSLSPSCDLTATTEENMRGHVDLAIQETNTAYGLSGIDVVLRLVHAYHEPSYVENAADAFGAALDNLVYVDGAMDDVHAKRTKYGADVVALLIDDPEYCGIAYVGPSRSLAFSVTSWSCATGYYSFGHEIAHNLGCNHDRGTADECGASGYNYGYRDPQGDFRTTLAYSCRTDQCDSNAASSCPRVQIYSNNYGYTYNGAIAGDANNDNARHINENAPTVAAFYDPPDVIPGTSGDPHFRTWTGDHFEYHGQCDMVLVKDEGFAEGLGIDVHIRTKLVRFWSYIKIAAIRIGDDVLEVKGSAEDFVTDENNHYWINSEYQGNLDSLGGFPITYQNKGKYRAQRWFTSTIPGNKRARKFEIDLSSKYPGQSIVISAFKEFVRVDFKRADNNSFGNSTGMLGNFQTGTVLARDGATTIDDFAALGNEWQVRPADGMLFHAANQPQFPEKCVEPKKNLRETRRRRLGEVLVTQDQAEEACGSLENEWERKDCIYDVLATQDVTMVGAY